MSEKGEPNIKHQFKKSTGRLKRQKEGTEVPERQEMQEIATIPKAGDHQKLGGGVLQGWDTELEVLFASCWSLRSLEEGLRGWFSDTKGAAWLVLASLTRCKEAGSGSAGRTRNCEQPVMLE